MIPNPSDPDTTVCLCDAGLVGWEAVEVITPDGGRHLLLANPDAINDCYRSTADVAPHEETGPLPASVRRRLAAVQPRCGRPTRRGSRCRAPVTRPGGACSWHRTRAIGGTTERPRP